jgi:uncharacterized membrane protein YidH (DUF202 family)
MVNNMRTQLNDLRFIFLKFILKKETYEVFSMVMAVVFTCVIGVVIAKPEIYAGVVEFVKNRQPLSQMAASAFLVGIIAGGFYFTIMGYLAFYRRIKKRFSKTTTQKHAIVASSK